MVSSGVSFRETDEVLSYLPENPCLTQPEKTGKGEDYLVGVTNPSEDSGNRPQSNETVMVKPTILKLVLLVTLNWSSKRIAKQLFTLYEKNILLTILFSIKRTG